MQEVENFFGNIIKKVDSYKEKTGKTYNQIADEIGMSKKSFANLRNDWKNNRGYPRKETLDKLKKIF